MHTIRPGTAADLPAINDIYNHYVRTSTATFDADPMCPAEREAWWNAHATRHPVLVAEDAGLVVGWASLSPYSGRCAYGSTVEDSIYIRPEACGRGLGRRLLEALLEAGRAGGFHTIVAIISAESLPSRQLHARAGFREVGRLVEVGWKFGRRLDTVLMQRMLSDA